MNPVKARKLGSVLKSKGFEDEERDHTYYILYQGDKKTSIRTKISHGIKEYGANLLAQMSKELHLSIGELDRFIDCTISYADYIDLLVERNHLTGPVVSEERE